MNIEKHLLDSAKMAVRAEIEKAIDKVKLGMIPRKPRTKLDEWFRRRYYIKAARWKRYCERKQNKGSRQRLRRKLRKQRSKPISFHIEKNQRGDDACRTFQSGR